ncbi:MAG TPA: DUF455 family protein [Leptospiraceae bacterium]|nr:DUF455 family protein [Leptospirales bacterium]HMU83296.1 DUF455 family protein [Leptospiraceae bacterium]HMW60147.1 DUF455 family protein [Leptospiraceae bacterium]HMX58134.1 DUF455 family protein [Leptospiraceae bacterium]HMY45954.1 DUF455 family protein [Leptospiraceae bacterium]
MWAPFRVETGAIIAPRPLPGIDGIGDRLRTAAFAEMQAERAFARAAEIYSDAPESLRSAWLHLASEENRHMNWLLGRMKELNIDIVERPVSDSLWNSLMSCKDARSFCHYIADSEQRGRRAGLRFYDVLKDIDPTTAEIFSKIAEEEIRHIELAFQFYPIETASR